MCIRDFDMEERKLGIADVHDFVGSLNKTTKQCMIRVINNLIRKIKVMKVSENEKKKRKHERFFEEVQVLKRTHPKEATIFALKNTKCIQEIVSTQRRALVRVATETLLAKEISAFRSKFPGWRDELPLILSSLGTKWKVNNKLKTQDKRRTAKSKEIKSSSKKEKDWDSRKSNENDEKNRDFITCNPEFEAPVHVNKKEGDLEIKTINMNASFGEDEEFATSVRKSPSTEENRSSSIAKPAVKDSFFLGGGDESEDSPDESTNIPKKPRQQHQQKTHFGKSRSHNTNDYPSRNGGYKNSFNQHNDGRNGMRQQSNNSALHPSWVAKKETNKSSITEFKGKKTVFDEGISSKQTNIHPSWAAKKTLNKTSISEFKGTKTVFGEEGTPGSDTIDLHPSWAAKKAANKSSIQAFQGKKIVFDI